MSLNLGFRKFKGLGQAIRDLNRFRSSLCINVILKDSVEVQSGELCRIEKVEGRRIEDLAQSKKVL